MPVVFDLATGVSAIGAVFVLSGSDDWTLLLLVGGLATGAVVFGFLLSIFASGIGVDLSDPYLSATILSTCLPVLTGVIVPLEFTPPWFQTVASFIPSAQLIQAVHGAHQSVPILVDQDVLMALIGAVIGHMRQACSFGTVMDRDTQSSRTGRPY